MSDLSWREHAAPIIQRVLEATQGQDDKAVRKALRDAYPFGQRAYHPYKVWCDEVKRQRGIRPMTALHRRQIRLMEEHQASLFAPEELVAK